MVDQKRVSTILLSITALTNQKTGKSKDKEKY